MNNKKGRNDARWSLRVLSADLLNLERDLRLAKEAGCHELHLDITDGAFAPGFGLNTDFVRLAKERIGLPCDVHLQVARSERYIESCIEAGCDSLTIHVEACIHTDRALTQIRDLGASPGIAINPATPLTKLEYLLHRVDRVLVLGLETGGARSEILPSTFERVQILAENLSYQKRSVIIQVEGGLSDAKSVALLLKSGATHFVLNNASAFHNGEPAENFQAFVRDVEQQLAVV